VKHRTDPHPEWRRAINEAWDRLDRYRGIKKDILASAGIGKSTQDRMRNEPEKVALDSWEDLRLAMVKAYGEDSRLKGEPVPDLPPPLVPVRSGSHYRAVEALGGLAEAGRLDMLAEWISVGKRLLLLGILPEVLEPLLEKVEREEDLAASNDRLSRAIRTVGHGTSDPAGKTSHGSRRQRPAT